MLIYFCLNFDFLTWRAYGINKTPIFEIYCTRNPSALLRWKVCRSILHHNERKRAHWKPFSLLPICAHFPFRFGCNRPVFRKGSWMKIRRKMEKMYLTTNNKGILLNYIHCILCRSLLFCEQCAYRFIMISLIGILYPIMGYIRNCYRNKTIYETASII